MEDSSRTSSGPTETTDRSGARRLTLIVLLFAAAVYLGCIISPPSLLDDVDAVQAQIAHTMLTSGDWVTARLDGVAYLEKPPLIYWMTAICFKLMGVRDWVARIPVALSAIALAWLTTAFGMWSFGRRAGFYAGLCMATCVGIFLFTRVLFPDVMLTFTVTLAMWALLRALDDEERRPLLWAVLLAASLGVGLLLKSLIGVVFPVAAAVIYLLLTKQFFSARTWKRLHPFLSLAVILIIAAPWHILATMRNPPYFSFTMRSVPGEYHGFFWFFFFNEQLLRFLNLRYPRDYNTVPRLYFWLLQLVWLFPWSVYLPAAAGLSYKPVDRAGKTRLLAVCWMGFILLFFTFSTTQEYYSMPGYPALALIIGSAMAAEGRWVRGGTRALTLITGAALCAAVAILIATSHVPAPGDISSALAPHPKAYTLSLGHMEDLTINSMAYLRVPLALAALSFLIGTIGTINVKSRMAYLAPAVMMVVFFQAARLAMVKFDPYLSSRPLVRVLEQSPPGTLIIDHHYYWFSSVFFYTDRNALLLNGRFNNLVYGSYAPGAQSPFVNDDEFKSLWSNPDRSYIIARQTAVDRLQGLVGKANLDIVATSGGKVLCTNHPLARQSDATSQGTKRPL